jgi:D-glycero-beta-D-manno-heptose-7-phosphate kinase
MSDYSIHCDRLNTIVSKFKSASLIVIGDVMIDEYMWGDVRRISPEAPVPVVEIESVTRRLGGAANVVQNLQSIGITPKLISICGKDDNAKLLKSILADINCSSEGLVESSDRPTIIKTRIMARTQQVVRADRELIRDLSVEETDRVWALFEKAFPTVDGVIISDYGKGTVSQPLIEKIIGKCVSNKKFVAIDPKDRHFDLYKGVTVITPNLKEAHAMLGIPYRNCSDEDIKQIGWKILDNLNLHYLLLTLSERGMALFDSQKRTMTHLPTVAQKVFDVTGAGDTVISVFSAAFTCGASPLEAAFISNYAAGLTVAQLGTASVTPDELLTACGCAGSSQ